LYVRSKFSNVLVFLQMEPRGSRNARAGLGLYTYGELGLVFLQTRWII
jgi:hypothetical protein